MRRAERVGLVAVACAPSAPLFFGVHNLDTDSKGNLYATETYTGARVQRFIYKGVSPVTNKVQGVPWPRR